METDSENNEISRRMCVSWSYDAPITRTLSWRGSLRKSKKDHVGFRFVDDKEGRAISSVSYDDGARGWIASTSLVGDDGDISSDVDYYLNTHIYEKNDR